MKFDVSVYMRNSIVPQDLIKSVHDEKAFGIEVSDSKEKTILSICNSEIQKRYKHRSLDFDLNLATIEKSSQFDANTNGSIKYSVRSKDQKIVLFLHNKIEKKED